MAKDLSQVREELDRIDSQLASLFTRRMDLAADVIAAKSKTGKAVADPARERQKLAGIARMVPDRFEPQAISLFSLIMSMNRAEQKRIQAESDPQAPSKLARASFAPVDEAFPAVATVACQGVEGAYSQIAACRLFEVPQITFFDGFGGVCRAVADGLCEFGVLPIENSTAGSVNAVYDLIAQHRVSIVRSLRQKIDHNLLALPGTRLPQIREVISHNQAISQCAGYLNRLGVSVTAVENTAKAAEIVASSGRDDLAALSSRSCSELYGLDILEADVQDSDNNYTRFVVIANGPKIYPGADRSSILLTLKNEPGALYRVLERIYALDINLVKLESRPIPGRDFEFMFYFDLDCPACSPSFAALLDSLDDVCGRFHYFGSYSEVL